MRGQIEQPQSRFARRYDAEFKRNAVALVRSGRSAKAVAGDPGTLPGDGLLKDQHESGFEHNGVAMRVRRRTTGGVGGRGVSDRRFTSN